MVSFKITQCMYEISTENSFTVATTHILHMTITYQPEAFLIFNKSFDMTYVMYIHLHVGLSCGFYMYNIFALDGVLYVHFILLSLFGLVIQSEI